MIYPGLAFLLFWLLVRVFSVELSIAAIVTAVVFIVVGVLRGERL
jgi:hypothetical protein